jgi:hypothetical protein
MDLKKVIDNPALLPPLKTLTGYRPVKGSSLFENRVEYLAEYAVDEDPHTRWLPRTDDREPTLTVDLEEPKRFNSVVLMEPYEAHILAFELQYLHGDEWKTVLEGTSIGSTYSRQFPAVEGRMARLVVKKFIVGENRHNVVSFPGKPPPGEGATIAEFQLLHVVQE